MASSSRGGPYVLAAFYVWTLTVATTITYASAFVNVGGGHYHYRRPLVTAFYPLRVKLNNCFVTSNTNILVAGPSTDRCSLLASFSIQNSALSLDDSHHDNNNNNNDDDDNNDNNDNENSASVLRSVTFCNLRKGKENDNDKNVGDKDDMNPHMLCDFLMEIGACSVSMMDADAGTENEYPLFWEEQPMQPKFNKNDDSDKNSMDHSDSWTDRPVWNRCNVTAHFAASVNISHVLDLVAECFPGYYNNDKQHQHALKIETVPNRDWVVHVQSSWKPIVVANKFVLRFPWHTEQDVIQQVAVALPAKGSSDTNNKNNNDDDNNNDNSNDWIEVKLQGGIAFGTGEHPTTQMCMEWLHQILPQAVQQVQHNDDDDSKTFWIMDYGSGSGILGIAACKLLLLRQPPNLVPNSNKNKNNNSNNNKIRAVGIDIDADACRIANENAQTNQVPMKNYLPLLSAMGETDWTTNTNNDYDDDSKALLLKAQYRHAQWQWQHQESSNNNDDNNDNDFLCLPKSLESQRYHVCVANILAGPLIALAPKLYALTLPGGYLGLSGILERWANPVVRAYETAGFVHVQIMQQRNGWVLITATKAKSAP